MKRQSRLRLIAAGSLGFAPFSVFTFAEHANGYGLTLILLFSAGLAFTFAALNFGGFTARSGVLWMTLISTFIAYPMKSVVLWMFRDRFAAESQENLMYELFSSQNVSSDDLYAATLIGSIGFIVLATLLGWYAFVRNVSDPGVQLGRRRGRYVMWSRLWLLAVLSIMGTIFINYVALQLGILRFGVEQVALPFRLAGIILLLRQILDTVFPIVIVSLGVRAGPRQVCFGLVVVLVAGVVSGISSGSKASILAALLHGVFILAIWGQLRILVRREVGFALVAMSVLGVLYAGFSHYVRMMAGMDHIDLGILKQSLAEWVSSMHDSLISEVGQLFAFLYYRATGVEQLPILITRESFFSRLDLWKEIVVAEMNLGTYYTSWFLGIVSNSYSAAPGLFGGAWMLGGTWGMIPLISCAIFLWAEAVRRMAARLRVEDGWDVAIALVIGHLITLLIDGDFISVLRPAVLVSLIVKCAVGLAVVKTVLRASPATSYQMNSSRKCGPI